MQIYKVGGYVRDKLLGLTPHDCDYVVVGATANLMLQHGFIQVGKDFPVFIHPKTKQEYALARTERKIFKGHTGFEVNFDPTITLTQDLYRRDLTINAIAEDDQGNLIDPYNGQSDLQHKIIRHVSDAFIEDPLRILRAVRFAAKLNFTIHPSTLKLMQDMANTQQLLELSKERIFDELHKAISNDNFGDYLKYLDYTNNLTLLSPSLKKILSDKLIQQLNQLNSANQRYYYLAYNKIALSEITNKKNLIKCVKITHLLTIMLNMLQVGDYAINLQLTQLKINNNYGLIDDILDSIKLFNEYDTKLINNLQNVINHISKHKFNFTDDDSLTQKLAIINDTYNKIITTLLR